MSTQRLKSIAWRGTLLTAAFALVAAVVPAPFAYADALNPLTERSLLLTSSAPGYQNTDGSGNSAANLNSINEYYAPPGSGPNGQKTGETFTFNVSTDSSGGNDELLGMTFQYCIEAAGYCAAPGNNTGDADPNSDGDTSDSTREANSATTIAAQTSDLEVVYPGTTVDGDDAVAGDDFEIWVNGVHITAGGAGTGWSMELANVEDHIDHTDPTTGKNNFIRLINDGSTPLTPAPGQEIRVVFNADDTGYITNPGDGAFFVKINTYDTGTPANMLPSDDTYVVDGGVTVANVMTDSIHITTKVLETMQFSVGTRNKDTVELNCPGYTGTPAEIEAGCEAETGAEHGTCDAIQQINDNRLSLGNPNAEYSLETDTAWDVFSYWRLSSNSSGGASVYYSGDTLRNTVGDHIAANGTSAVLSNPGTEQFGLGFVDAGADTFSTDFTAGIGTDFETPALNVLVEEAAYNTNAGGNINGGSIDAQFAFTETSLTSPELIAQNGDTVISCDTAKMRYVANIGADTPAGVYTTKINYLAAPQY